jgi:uncharacterized protein (TIGR02452 family)
MSATKNLEDIQKQNKIIWKDTYRIAENYPYKNAEKITDLEEIPQNLLTEKLPKVVKVFNENLMTVIDVAIKAKFRPLILISANDNYPLESVKHGLSSPECDLYRASNISATVNENLYPLRDLEMIYCSKITIFRNSQNRLLTKPYQVSLLLSPPVRRPSLITIRTEKGMEDTYSNSLEEEKMKNKIENIFKFAMLKGFNCVILSDFGCQNENNPIRKIIKFFNESIQKYNIKYVFFSVKTENDPFETKKKSGAGRASVKVDKNFEFYHIGIKRKF